MVNIDVGPIIGSFRPHYDPGVDSAANRNEYQEYFLEGKEAGALPPLRACSSPVHGWPYLTYYCLLKQWHLPKTRRVSKLNHSNWSTTTKHLISFHYY